jgi:hypothetical protein
MNEEFLKRGYNFPPKLLEAWAEFHAPTKDYSPSAAGAFLLYMVVEPALRESLRKLACENNVKKAKIEARKQLRETIVNAFLTGFVGDLSPEDRAILIERAVQAEKTLSGKR